MTYKVCLSQVFPIIYNASNILEALSDLKKLIDAFAMNGFNRRSIGKNIVFFLDNNEFPNTKYSVKDLKE